MGSDSVLRQRCLAVSTLQAAPVSNIASFTGQQANYTSVTCNYLARFGG